MKPIDPEILTEANRIKDRMRECQNEGELLCVCDEERQNVRRLADSGDEARVLAFHISNLKAYLITSYKGFPEQKRRPA